jgi:hypothetical protein
MSTLLGPELASLTRRRHYGNDGRTTPKKLTILRVADKIGIGAAVTRRPYADLTTYSSIAA